MKALKSALVAAALLLQSWLNGGCSASSYPPPVVVVTPNPPYIKGTELPYSDGTFLCSSTALEPHTLTTARHCVLAAIEGGSPGFVVMPDGSMNEVVNAWVSPTNDAALLTVKDALPMVMPAARELPAVGDILWIAGYGCDSHAGGTDFIFELRVSPLTYLGRDIHGAEVYHGTVCHGDSGGAVFNAKGQLVAIVVAGGENSEGVSSFVLAEPLSTVLDGLAP